MIAYVARIVKPFFATFSTFFQTGNYSQSVCTALASVDAALRAFRWYGVHNLFMVAGTAFTIYSWNQFDKPQRSAAFSRQKQALFQGLRQNELVHFSETVEKAEEATAMIRSTWEKLIADCQEYKRRVRLPLTNPATNRKDPDKILRASWEHFADFAGETGPDLSRLLLDYRAWIDAGGRIAQGGKGKRKATDGDGNKNGDGDGGGDGWDTKKIECCEELLRLSNFIRAELATSEFWGGNLSLKSSFIQKQNWDGYAFKEKQEIDASASGTITVKFADAGTVDPFG